MRHEIQATRAEQYESIIFKNWKKKSEIEQHSDIVGARGFRVK